MNNKKFIKIISQIPLLKDLIKSQNDWNDEYNNLIKSVEDNNLEEFNKLFNRKNPFLSFNYLAITSIKSNRFELFLKIDEEATKAKKTTSEAFPPSKEKFMSYEHVFHTALVHDNADVVKHLIEKQYIDIDTKKSHISTFYDIAKHDAFKVLHYFLYDLKIEITDDTMDILECDLSGKKHFHALNMITNRDLYFDLGKSLDESSLIKKPKTKKI